MGAMALMAARPRRDAMVAPAERSLTRPENFIFQHKEPCNPGKQDAMKARAISLNSRCLAADDKTAERVRQASLKRGDILSLNAA